MLNNLISFLLILFLSMLIIYNPNNANAGSTIEVPNANEFVDGLGASGFPFNCGNFEQESMRYQQMYASSEFNVNSCFITEIRFRRNVTASDFGPTVISNITAQLSTSPNTTSTMSNTFANNVGSDVVTVFQGDLTLSTSCGASDPCPFDQVIILEQGFLYDPNDGDLLLDFRIPTCTITAQQDGDRPNTVMARATTDKVANDGTLGVDATEADRLNLSTDGDVTKGLVTQFVCGEDPTAPSGPLVIIPTLSQWGMIFATIILGMFAVIRIRRKASE